MIDRRGFLAGTAALAFPLAGPARAAQDYSVVTTTGMIGDAARQVGGDLVAVRALMGPGVDPHSYRQTRTDIVAMTRADLVLWHGLYLEAQMEEFLHKLGARRDVVAVAEAMPVALLHRHADYADKFDPHVWMDPSRWTYVVDAVRAALTRIIPAAADRLAADAARHVAEIHALDTYCQEVLSGVPAAARVLVTAHDAFGYFGEAYDFEVLGIQGISTESEAGLNRIGELVDVLVDRRVAAVFVESSVSDRNIRALVEGAAARGHDVSIGGELYSDAMGPDGSYEGTYLGMIDHNATVIARALGADAPATGMNGKLTVGL